MRQELTDLQSDMAISLYHRLNTIGNRAEADTLKNPSLRKGIMDEVIEALKKDYPLATQHDVQAAIKQIGANV